MSCFNTGATATDTARGAAACAGCLESAEHPKREAAIPARANVRTNRDVGEIAGFSCRREELESIIFTVLSLPLAHLRTLMSKLGIRRMYLRPGCGNRPEW